MSGRIHLKDRYGNDLIFHNGGDIWCPLYPDIVDYRQHLKDLRHLELRKDDIILAGYPRSGEFEKGIHEYDVDINNDNNERISRALFHVKHAQLLMFLDNLKVGWWITG